MNGVSLNSPAAMNLILPSVRSLGKERKQCVRVWLVFIWLTILLQN